MAFDSREYSREYYRDHSTKMKETSKAYYRENKESCKQYAKDYYQRNKKHILELQRIRNERKRGKA